MQAYTINNAIIDVAKIGKRATRAVDFASNGSTWSPAMIRLAAHHLEVGVGTVRRRWPTLSARLTKVAERWEAAQRERAQTEYGANARYRIARPGGGWRLVDATGIHVTEGRNRLIVEYMDHRGRLVRASIAPSDILAKWEPMQHCWVDRDGIPLPDEDETNALEHARTRLEEAVVSLLAHARQRQSDGRPIDPVDVFAALKPSLTAIQIARREHDEPREDADEK